MTIGKVLLFERNLSMNIVNQRLSFVSMHARLRSNFSVPPQKAAEESAFSKYLDVDVQRQKMRELPQGRMLSSVYMQFKEDYDKWKAQQPEMNLPDSQGWTDENLAFLRERYGEDDLSANEIYDALSTMQDMGILSQKGKNCAVGITWVKVKISESGVCAINVDPDSRGAWLSGFDEAPMVSFRHLEDIISWAKEFREEDYPDFITRTEALARGWL